MNTLEFDFVVVGSGLAGSCAALLLSELGEVALISKEPAIKSNSYSAQGGIAAAVGMMDSSQWHVEDTLQAGDGLCDPRAVTQLVERAGGCIKWLLDLGVQFDRNTKNEFSLGLEGAHRFPRILHAGGDATGASVIRVLSECINTNPRIWVGDTAEVESLVRVKDTVHGVLTKYNDIEQAIIGKKATILATGGLGQLFAATTNPLGAKGEGVALAYEAGATIRNLEFVQFHPTALCGASNPKFLVSEAVRGAGAVLIDSHGRRIMEDHPQKDLAARDQVSRKIYEQQQKGMEVFLDGSRIVDFDKLFPTIFNHCLRVGINPKSQPIPVTPAAHFAMGGVIANIKGQTNVRGLYAIGEVSCTGVHGANRLASNSLLECVGMAHGLMEHLRTQDPLPIFERMGFSYENHRMADQNHLLEEVQSIMWTAAGIIRNEATLQWALARLQKLNEVNPFSKIITTARLIIQSALLRKESRGAHFRSDFPHRDTGFIRDTLVEKLHHGEGFLKC